MGNIHLVTGFAGQQHITSADQAVFNSLMFGGGQYVLAKGNQFAASIVTNNQVNVLDGDILMQGRHIRLNEATSVDLTIENGTQGQKRNDLIVVRYTKDENTGIEEANLVVIKGTAAESDPADPAYTSGDLVNDNAIMNDMPLYRVQLDGLNISGLVPLFEAVEIKLLNHASRHASNGDDAITPAMIGAASAAHTHIAADVGAVSQSGGKMTGNLSIEKSNPMLSLNHKDGYGAAVQDFSNMLALFSLNDYAASTGGDYRRLNVYNPAGKASLADALSLTDKVGSAIKTYPILHTGNIGSLYPAANVVTGSYVGTGTYGVGNKNSVALPEEPALFVVCRENYSNPADCLAVRVKGSTILAGVANAASEASGYCNAEWNESTSALEWYNTSATAKQFNTEGYNFFYVAIY